MIKRKTTAWLWGVVAFLFIASGLRDIFAPGFLSNAPPRGVMSIALTFVAGVIFLAVAVSQAIKVRAESDKPRT
jgi:hypothetical protein